MMRRAPIDDAKMHVGPGRLRKSLKKILSQLRLKVADPLRIDLSRDDAVWPSAQIDRRSRERFIHRHQEISRAKDAALVTDRFYDRFAERDASVFNGVVLIDVKVAFCFDREIERPVACHEIEHVIEKADAGRDTRRAASVEVETQFDVRLVGLAIDCGCAWHSWLASARFLEALDQVQEPFHLLLRADADADVTGRDVPTVAHDNLLFCEKWDQIVAIRAKINQHKVSGARVGLVAELVQLFNEPRPQTKNVFHVALHGFGIADSRFGGNQCGEIDREGGSCTPKNGERVWMRKDCSKTK